MPKSRTAKKLSASIAAVVLLAVCLCVTTFALAYSLVSVDGNRFQTGSVQIDLNGGKPVITADEFRFEPGMTVEKPFYIENQGTWDVITGCTSTGSRAALQNSSRSKSATATGCCSPGSCPI